MRSKFYPNYRRMNYGISGLEKQGGTYIGVTYEGQTISSDEPVVGSGSVSNTSQSPAAERTGIKENQTGALPGFKWMPFGGWTCLSGYGFSGEVGFGSCLKPK